MGGTPSVPEEKIPPERTFIVTGGNTGIGYETSKKIAQLGGRVIIACRSEERAQNALRKMKADTISEFAKFKKKKGDDNGENVPELNVQYMQVDLSSLESTIEFARRYKETGLPLHVLMCNAGVAVVEKTLTDDGYELQFQVNYLSHFLLTLLLLPLLKESAPNSRIVNVSSLAHTFPNCAVDLTNIQSQKSFSGPRGYGNSKLFQIMNMHSLSRRIEGSGVSIFSLHPGIVDTELTRNVSGCSKGCLTCLAALFSEDSASGSRTSLIAALEPKYDDKTTLYFSDGKPKSSSGLSRNTVKQEILWKYSLQCLRSKISDIILQEIGEKLEDIQPLENEPDAGNSDDVVTE